MTVDVVLGPAVDPGEATRVYWHPVDRRFVFRLFSVRNPVDLLFDGEYESPAPGTMRRTYRGCYADGRIHLYRETWTLESPKGCTRRQNHFTKGEWAQLFGGSVYARVP